MVKGGKGGPHGWGCPKSVKEIGQGNLVGGSNMVIRGFNMFIGWVSGKLDDAMGSSVGEVDRYNMETRGGEFGTGFCD